jgi:hypothetical protein
MMMRKCCSCLHWVNERSLAYGMWCERCVEKYGPAPPAPRALWRTWIGVLLRDAADAIDPPPDHENPGWGVSWSEYEAMDA